MPQIAYTYLFEGKVCSYELFPLIVRIFSDLSEISTRWLTWQKLSKKIFFFKHRCLYPLSFNIHVLLLAQWVSKYYIDTCIKILNIGSSGDMISKISIADSSKNADKIHLKKSNSKKALYCRMWESLRRLRKRPENKRAMQLDITD